MTFSSNFTILRETYKVSVSQAEMKEVKRQDRTTVFWFSALKSGSALLPATSMILIWENNRDIFNPEYQDYLETYGHDKTKKSSSATKTKLHLIWIELFAQINLEMIYPFRRLIYRYHWWEQLPFGYYERWICYCFRSRSVCWKQRC